MALPPAAAPPSPVASGTPPSSSPPSSGQPPAHLRAFPSARALWLELHAALSASPLAPHAARLCDAALHHLAALHAAAQDQADFFVMQEAGRYLYVHERQRQRSDALPLHRGVLLRGGQPTPLALALTAADGDGQTARRDWLLALAVAVRWPELLHTPPGQRPPRASRAANTPCADPAAPP